MEYIAIFIYTILALVALAAVIPLAYALMLIAYWSVVIPVIALRVAMESLINLVTGNSTEESRVL